MATITGFTAARMLAIENNSVVAGVVTGDNLILTRQGGGTINAGNVRGPQGLQGIQGDVSTAQMNAAIEASRATIQGAQATTTAMIALGAIVTDRLADLAVTTAKLAELAVTTSKLADNAVTAPKLADGAVTSAKILDGSIVTNDIADNAVTAAKILDGTVGTAELANGAVTPSKQSTVIIQAGQPPIVAGTLWVIL